MSSTPAAEARIGPNAVLQTLGAFLDAEGHTRSDALRTRAGVPDPLPPGMVPEACFTRLVAAVRAELSPRRADAVLADAGRRTADYVTTHRIPRSVQLLLRVLPRRVALPLLLSSVARHAWTFTGAGHFRVEGPYPGVLVLQHAPTCRAHTTSAPSGAYYAAAFEGLLRLAAPGIRVREVACQSRGAPACRFAIELPGTPALPR